MKIIGSNLTKTYEERLVLNVEHLEIPKGSFFGIIGPNGAGKTTLLHILGGLDEKHGGTISYSSDFVIGEDSTMLLQQAYMLRGTVGYNVEYPLSLRKTEKEQRVEQRDALLKRLELSHLVKQQAGTLSGGERQRLALARGLSYSPSLIIMDEPTASADPVSIKMMEHIFREEHQKGITLVLVTHNLAQAKRLCSHLCFLKEGQVLECGATEILLKTPQSQGLKEYIADQVL